MDVSIPYSVHDQPSKSFPILIVEDNEDHQFLVKQSLQNGFPQAKPVFVETPAQALAYLQEGIRHNVPTIRLVLLDIYLPVPDVGWKLLTDLRASYPQLPIIALSSHRTPEEVRRAYDLGAHSFVAKPLRIDQWLTYFDLLRVYWLETAKLPPVA